MVWQWNGKKITLLNLTNFDNETSIKTVIGDVCNMNMFDDGFFDIVFSNSLIEHVGDFQKQYEMAKEVDRVSNKYWIQTPNKNFPLDVHFCFPFLQYLPLKYQKYIVCYWPFSFAKMLGLNPIEELNNLRLISYSEMKTLFPESTILREKFLGFTKSFIAFKT